MDIKIKFRKIFKDLYNSDKGLFAFTLYSRYGIEPSEAIEFISLYEKQGIVKSDSEQRITLTNFGRESIKVVLSKLIIDNPKPNEYLESILLPESMPLYYPYLPDKMFYERYIKGRGK